MCLPAKHKYVETLLFFKLQLYVFLGYIFLSYVVTTTCLVLGRG